MEFNNVRAMRLGVGIVSIAFTLLLICVPGLAQRGDLRIPLPAKSRATPVQELNRDGVKELKRGHVKKAKQHFVKAYLLDPDDPFTLNNLGYIAEIEGEVKGVLMTSDCDYLTSPPALGMLEFVKGAADRFFAARRAVLSGPFDIVGQWSAPRVAVSPGAVPFRPSHGVYVVVGPAIDGE